MEGNGRVPRKYTKLFGHSRAWYLTDWMGHKEPSWVGKCSSALWLVVYKEIHV